MEPVLTAEIIRRLREGVGADVMDHLDLSNGLIVPRELSTVADCIKEYHHITHNVSPLQTIDLSGNLLCGIDEHGDGEYDLSGLTRFVDVLLLHGDKRPLKKIVLYHNNIGKDGCRILSALMNATSPNFLHDLNLRSCCLDDACLKNLISGLDNNKTIQNLDLRTNSFTANGMEVLSNCLFKNKSLRRLDLSHNHFGAPGMNHLCDKIGPNVTLQILALIDCGIGDDGCRHISNLLRYNTGLSHLDLQENNISDRGVEEISKGIVKNRSLQFLGLQYNDITNTGALYLGKAMRGNLSLKTLYLFGNRINEQGMGEAVHWMAWTQAHQVMFDVPVGEHVMK